MNLLHAARERRSSGRSPNPNRITSAQLPMSRSLLHDPSPGRADSAGVAPERPPDAAGRSLRSQGCHLAVRWSRMVHRCCPGSAIDKANGHRRVARRDALRNRRQCALLPQGALAFLDAPAEFFLDTRSATPYYWPRTTPNGIIRADAKNVVGDPWIVTDDAGARSAFRATYISPPRTSRNGIASAG